jgi:hypothetical protein
MSTQHIEDQFQDFVDVMTSLVFTDNTGDQPTLAIKVADFDALPANYQAALTEAKVKVV